jgi:hypothetical protein
MSLHPLTPVSDYQSMLNRIFWFTSAAALVAVWLLRVHLIPLDLMLAKLSFTLELEGERILPVPGGYLVPALAIGLISRVYRIHNKIADWLGIRERFEIDVIIRELASRSGVTVDDIPENLLVLHRYHIMRHGFYQFVSGRKPQIDELLVERALDMWSWFWIGLEATVLFVVTGFVLIASGVQQTGFVVLLSALSFAAIALPAIRSECRRYAIAQVRSILADPQRAALVRQALSCLEIPSAPQRWAA